MKPKIILLNGPSSSGKSTLAVNLQKAFEDKISEEYGIISIDDFLDMSVNDQIYEDDVFEISPKLCKAALQLANANRNIIIDHVITSERIFNQLIESLGFGDIYLIHVTCPLNELKRREQERQNRSIGSAEASFQYLFPETGYDLTVDTFQTSVEKCTQEIFQIIHSKPGTVKGVTRQ